MSSYKFIQSTLGGDPDTVLIVGTTSYVPMSQHNSLARQFAKDWKSGPLGTVKNADGTDAPYSDAAVITLGLEPLSDEDQDGP